MLDRAVDYWREILEQLAPVADGFSCREQVMQATDRRPLHVAEVVKLALDETKLEQLDGSPEDHADQLRPPGLVRRRTCGGHSRSGSRSGGRWLALLVLDVGEALADPIELVGPRLRVGLQPLAQTLSGGGLEQANL